MVWWSPSFGLCVSEGLAVSQCVVGRCVLVSRASACVFFLFGAGGGLIGLGRRLGFLALVRCGVFWCVVLCRVVLCCVVLRCSTLCCAVLWCAIFYPALLCHALPRRAMSCLAVLCCAAPRCAVLRRAVPCRAVRCRGGPCCVVMCPAVVCRAVPCCAVLCCAVLRCAVLRCAVLCRAGQPHPLVLRGVAAGRSDWRFCCVGRGGPAVGGLAPVRLQCCRVWAAVACPSGGAPVGWSALGVCALVW